VGVSVRVAGTIAGPGSAVGVDVTGVWATAAAVVAGTLNVTIQLKLICIEVCVINRWPGSQYYSISHRFKHKD